MEIINKWMQLHQSDISLCIGIISIIFFIIFALVANACEGGEI